ncbi:unnamed protein product [Toxocara canis]|uniref:SAM domain-containing protein n=1 Tax=Toxocara canis TaxID=6265 RepID=A0A183TYW2_TOXCA|nr:unnamed protein product [Toxocara canis]
MDRMEKFQDLGIAIPNELKAVMNALHSENVELSLSYKEKQASAPSESRTADIPKYDDRFSAQELDREKAGDSLIAAEIRMLQDREDELKRSRSELGLPNLEDTIQIWRTGDQSYNDDRLRNQDGNMLAQRASNMRSLRLSSTSKSHRYDGYDVMIYGPTTTQWQKSTDPTPPVFGAPVLSNAHGLRLIRYE